MTHAYNVDSHRAAADEVLAAVCSGDERLYQRVRFEHHVMPGHMPAGNWRRALAAAYELLDQSAVADHVTVANKAHGVEVSWMAEKIALLDPEIDVTLETKCKIVCAQGRRLLEQEVVQAAATRLQRGEPSDETLDLLLRQLSGLQRMSARQATARSQEHAAINREAWGEQSYIAPFGHSWLDAGYGGYMPGQIVTIAGAFKQRKTTVALNFALALAVSGVSVGVISREMLQGQLQAKIEAMLAVSRLLEIGRYNATHQVKNGAVPVNAISDSVVQRFWGSYDRLAPDAHQAIGYAQERYQKLGWRIYDAQDRNGGVITVKDLERTVLADIAQYGGRVFFADYAQLFKTDGESDYEAMQRLYPKLLTLATQNGICIVMLAQMNKAGADGYTTYSGNISGGIDASKTSHNVITTLYNHGDLEGDPNTVRLTMKAARHGYQGDGVFRDMPIHPPSGLILDMQWVKELISNG